jgi:hypothetical protein
MIKILYDEDNEDNFYMLGGRLKAARVRDRDAPDGERAWRWRRASGQTSS